MFMFPCSPIFNLHTFFSTGSWMIMITPTAFLIGHICPEKSIEELTESLWLTTIELEATRVRVQEEIKARDDQLNQLKHLLNEAINERNEARNECQNLILDKLLLQQHNNNNITTALPQSGLSSVEDEPIVNCGFSSSDCEESIVSSPPVETAIQLVLPPKGLPEQGKFLEAVMKAGPLLQNLLLAGPLPHWRHPPPQLDAYRIPSPPLAIATQPLYYTNNAFEVNKKRGFSEDSLSSTETKYQRISLN
ncbi:hypothetical protein HanRHA438_Chr14g0667091 [Helianthus annuus]|uniref:Uncharacterized protein n=1 Tax=Helianthus annuus TaxID=4232 RepID=A0A251SJM5_HELAN|nr:hypothetical protein HanXRQr2_Chr14g0656161 [Helianthus annuus]KAJ0465093.1 hypothetical protein HanHA300_Chr14g0534541 [Helianthus annuus]KAJ0469805.1 hypothetical protein HanIR_Chr14g0711891 [Helianthus annuus]KAJ0486685.1 hypothetical protein HanHA89_Chr14g0582341 [Helianthus annuus]KAJ0660817.1 hypothetical protein HanOQP8_Chr14g0541911 [Helianthus annuus]